MSHGKNKVSSRPVIPASAKASVQQPPDQKCCSTKSRRAQASEFAKQARRRIVEQPRGARAVFMSMKPSLNWLLIFVPVAFALRFWPCQAHQTSVFVCSAIAIIPVAGGIGRATEELAAQVGEGLGGLLNATFGNA